MNLDEMVNHMLPFSNLDERRLISLAMRAASAVCLHGAFVECGSGHGSSAALLAGVLDRNKSAKPLWICDTFEGLPPLVEGLDTARDWTPQMYKDVVGSAASTEAEVIERCRELGPRTDIRTVKGLFADTLPTLACGPIALLHVDCDWHYSTRDVLEYLYPLVVRGGIVVIDDYHYWSGCRKAVLEYFAANPPEPTWHGGGTAVWGLKP